MSRSRAERWLPSTDARELADQFSHSVGREDAVDVYGIKHAAQHGLSAQSAASIAAGIAIGAAFIARQWRLAQPMIDLRLFRVRAFSTALAANVLGAFVMYGIFFFTSQYLQLVIGLSPLEAGLWSLPPLGALMA